MAGGEGGSRGFGIGLFGIARDAQAPSSLELVLNQPGEGSV